MSIYLGGKNIAGGGLTTEEKNQINNAINSINEQLDTIKNDVNSSLSNKADVSHAHNYNDLTNKPTIPSKTSDLANDSGFLTSIPSEYVTEEEMNTALSNKANKSDIPTKVSALENDSSFVTLTEMTTAINDAKLEGGNTDIDLSAYQLIQDNTLNTTAKTIPDAINELKSIIDILQDRVAALENQHGSYLKYDV